MTRFALFGGEECYPRGGGLDLVAHGTLDECKARFSTWCDPVLGYREFDWAHIVDLDSMKIILIAGGDDTGTVVWRQPQDC